LLVLGEGLEQQVSEAVLHRRVSDWSEEGKAAALTRDDVLPRRERDIAACAGAALPDREAQKLETVEWSAGEVQFSVGELACGLIVGRGESDRRPVGSPR
jgi:hypothetical protein